jgi:hypothetical protein
MTNADVIALARAGIADDIIVARIQAAPATEFDTGTAGLQALQAAHISGAVIKVMIAPHGAADPRLSGYSTNASSNDPELPHPPGIYLYASDTHTLTELQRAKAPDFKHTGGLARGLSHGIGASKSKVVIAGAHAPVVSAETNPVFYVYVPADVGSFGGSYLAPKDFTLVRFAEKNGARELVEGSSSILSARSGIEDKAKQGFTPEQVKPGIYKLTLAQQLTAGEYAFAQNRLTFFDFEIAPPPAQ